MNCEAVVKQYGGGGGMLWQKAASPVSRYIVLKSTTRSMAQSQYGYNNAILAACGAVIYVSNSCLFVEVVICDTELRRIDSLVPTLELISVLCFAKY